MIPTTGERRDVSGPAVLGAVFVIATAGLVYELVAGALASYLLGDSITQFSTVIGVYLSAMGLGAWLSGKIDRGLVSRFIEIEILVALAGGFSSTILFFAFSSTSIFRPVLYGLVALIGTLVGLEIPLLMRILKDRYTLKDLVARVLTFDYLGALLGSLAFPLILVPKLGLVRGALVVGVLNAAVALASTWLFAPLLQHRFTRNVLRAEAVFALVALLTGVALSDRLISLAEEDVYPDPVIYARSSSYQRIIVTRGKASFQLYLNGNLQFASADEQRYHESLVHPAMMSADAKKVLVLGGGDGLAVREILRHPVTSVTLVDLDPVMTELAATHPLFVEQNRGSFADPRVKVINDDAMAWIAERRTETYDVIIIDFPDPNSFSLGKLYTTRFYKLVRAALSPHGAVVVQATSPLLARQSFWCVERTMAEVGFYTAPYHANVPSFGEWGYVLAKAEPFDRPTRVPDGELRYLTPGVLAGMFEFSPDMDRVPAEVNRLNNQMLVHYYEKEWSKWY